MGWWSPWGGGWWADLLIGVAMGMLIVWLALLVTLFVIRPEGNKLTEAARLLPDLVRLMSRLARDRSLPRGVRVRLWLLLGYLAIPVDLVPDFIPVLGHADDTIVVVAVLRSVVRRAGSAAVGRHWPGSPDGLAAVRRLAGLSNKSET